MNDYTMNRNPKRMSPHELAGLLHTIADNATDGARTSGTLTWHPTGRDQFTVQGSVVIDDEVVPVSEWRMPREPFRWYAIGGLTNLSANEPPGVRGPDARVVRTTAGAERIRYYRLPSGRWCHQPDHHLEPRAGEECTGIIWPVLINLHGCLEEDT